MINRHLVYRHPAGTFSETEWNHLNFPMVPADLPNEALTALLHALEAWEVNMDTQSSYTGYDPDDDSFEEKRHVVSLPDLVTDKKKIPLVTAHAAVVVDANEQPIGLLVSHDHSIAAPTYHYLSFTDATNKIRISESEKIYDHRELDSFVAIGVRLRPID
ncbi:MAG: hypothetical protein Q4C10_08655 [Clostridia bacterium]|nr:hypothetical protein [Clostridia bacterium]